MHDQLGPSACHPLEARFLTVFSLCRGYEQSLKMTETFMSLALSNILALSFGRYVTQSPVSDYADVPIHTKLDAVLSNFRA